MAPRDHAVAPATMEAYFDDLARALDGLVAPGETGTARFAAEVSDFVRMNRGQVRQPGSVTQAYLDVDLVRGTTHAVHSLSLTGDLATDRAALKEAVAGLRAALPDLAPDPHLALPAEVASSRHVADGALPPAEDIVGTVLDAAAGLDLVGLYAGGPVYRGYANTLGQRNWHAATCFNLQWSLYHRADKAVKCAYSGLAWDSAAFAAAMTEAKIELAKMTQPAVKLAPGRYRAYLTPAAMEDLVSLLGWGGFSARALATRQSPLTRMRGQDNGDAGLRLDPRVTMTEATADGVAPAFQDEGFARPARVPLIDAGRLVGALVSPRTAREFGDAFGPTNGANASEGPEALEMARRHAAGARRAGGARHRPVDRQPPLPQLLRPQRLPDDRHDALRDVLGRRGEDRRAGRRAALRRYALPRARQQPRGADRGDRAPARQLDLSPALARQHAPARRAALRAHVHALK